MSLFIAVAFYACLALVLPTVLAWRRSGVFPVVFHRETGSAQRIAGLMFGLFLVALVGWSLLVALTDPHRLGIWEIPVWLTVLGWTLFLVGLGITVLGQAQMGRSWRIGIDDRPTKLITGGVFKFSRNPIFSGMIATLCGGVLIAPALWSVLGLLPAVMLISVQVRFEERHLLRMHRTEYVTYAARVGRFLPWLGRLDDAAARVGSIRRQSAAVTAGRRES